MRKYYYTDYVAHAMRYWFSYPHSRHFKNRADRLNWQACNAVMYSKTAEEKEMLKKYYCYGLSEHTIAAIYHKSDNLVYTLIGKTAREVAKHRNLI